jgi:hypothetical protein
MLTMLLISLVSFLSECYSYSFVIILAILCIRFVCISSFFFSNKIILLIKKSFYFFL